jgi:hypothetical protein
MIRGNDSSERPEQHVGGLIVRASGGDRIDGCQYSRVDLGKEQLVFAREVIKKGPGRDVGRVGNIGHGCRVVAARLEQVDRRINDGRARSFTLAFTEGGPGGAGPVGATTLLC